jgi:hypothetical protein
VIKEGTERMTGCQPGPKPRRDPGDPRSPRRTLCPYGPRDEAGPDAADARSGARHDHRSGRHSTPPKYQAGRYGAQRGRPRSPARPWEQPGPARPAVPRGSPVSLDHSGGAVGNERLTAATGAVLLVLFAAEGFTILSIHQMITLHFFLGMLLIGPVALKIGTVVYRFARYYSGAPEYRRKGPPAPLLRLLGPFVVLTSVGVIGTGVMLAVAGSAAGPWLFLHKAFFVLWFGVMTIHVLAYVWRLPRLIGSDLRGPAGLSRPHAALASRVLAGRTTRWLLVAASIAGGLFIATMTLHLAGPWAGFHHSG